jgi:hypothetical protein
MKQRTTEWLEITKNGSAEYHEKQYREIKRSTIKFFDWLESKGIINPDSKLSIADMASGMGANLRYMAERYLKSNFLGIDINSFHAANFTCNKSKISVYCTRTQNWLVMSWYFVLAQQ